MKGRGVFTIKRFALGATCALVCAGGGLAPAAGASASSPRSLQGNRQGINLARRVLSAFSNQPAFNYAQRGFFQMNTVSGKAPNVSYYYGYGALHAGFVWAAEHGTVALRSDQVV